jgi:hypothetical protein
VRRISSALGTIVLGLAACSQPTWEGDLRTMCDAPLKVPALPTDKDPSERAIRIAEYIEKNLATEDGRKLWTDLDTLADANSKKKAIYVRTQRAGITRCPLIEDEL